MICPECKQYFTEIIRNKHNLSITTWGYIIACPYMPKDEIIILNENRDFGSDNKIRTLFDLQFDR